MFIPVPECPPLVRKRADGFKDLLMTKEAYRSFVSGLCGAIFGLGGFCNVKRHLFFAPSVSTIGRFYKKGSASKLNKRHRKHVLQALWGKMHAEPGRFLLVIDDTLIERYGQKTWGAYNWHDHKRYVYGHKLLVVGLVDRKTKLLIPLIWVVLHQEERKSGKGWEIALESLDQLCEEGFPKLTVVADSWFGGKEFFEALVGRGYSFVVELKCNRKIIRHAKKKGLDVRVDDFFPKRNRKNIYHGTKRKYAAEANLVFRGMIHPLKTVAVSNRMSLDEKPFAYYVSNRLTWNASKIWGCSRDRWSIEVQFRDAKQIFALGEAAVRQKNSVETAISIAMIALTVIRLEQYARLGAKMDQYVRPIPAGSIARDLQIECLRSCVSKLAIPHQKRYWQRFQQQLNPENFTGKPAERRRSVLNLEQQDPERIAA